jgi:hypothetical protein
VSVYLNAYTRALKGYDRDLFAARNLDGVACVFRRWKRFEPVFEWEGGKLSTLIEDKQFVCALTDTWNLRGRPIDWGIDDVVGHIKKIDRLANERFFEELDAQNERVEQSKKRHLRNEMEAFWIDQRRAFAKATDDILTHSLSKDEPKKRLKDRSIKNGNC